MRTLPLRLAPIEGESLPGYVARYSHTYQFGPGDVLRALGLDSGTGTVRAAGRYGAWLSGRQIEQVAIATGIDPATIERMLLSRYAGHAFGQPTGPMDTALAAAAPASEILIRCSRFCPHCLHERGAWLLGWQLRWSFACDAHRVLLLRRCPACAAVPVTALRERWPRDHGGSFGPDALRASLKPRAVPRLARVRRHLDSERSDARCATPHQPAPRWRGADPDARWRRAGSPELPARPQQALQPSAPLHPDIPTATLPIVVRAPGP